MSKRASFLAVLLVSACTGVISEPFAESGGPTGVDREPGTSAVDPSDARQAFGATGARRLNRTELRNTLEDLLGSDPGNDVELMPADARTPFDNDWTQQTASSALIEGAKAVADRAAARLLADTTTRNRIVGCTPTGPSDEACLRRFIESFGARALRRPLAPEEIDAYATFVAFGTRADNFYTAVSMVIRAMLQDLEFLYRVEIGTPVADAPNVYQLSGYEIASRLSYFLVGTTPDEELFAAAAADELRTAEQIRAQALRLLALPRARDRIAMFHAQWLGYDQSALPGDLAPAMQRETRALIERVVFEEHASWLDLFTIDETYVDDALASHYGLPATGSTEPRWVSYGTEVPRQGILSHATFLSVDAKFDDTSPVQRGILVRKRLLCQEIPPPPPGVNTDEPPASETENPCKAERYAMHATGGCASCHSQIDPIGFGLEQFDQVGRFRTYDNGRPECEISGDGAVPGLGDFNGPAGLSDLLVSSGQVEQCLVQQVFKFALGRDVTLDDANAIGELSDRFTSVDRRFDELLVEFVTSPAFLYRVDE